MKNSSIRFILALLTLVIGGAAEELLPKFFGVGFPVLLSAVPFFSMRPSVTLLVFFALAAGGAEDALAGLPFLTSASYFIVVAALSRWLRLPSLVSLVAFPLYQVWLKLWCSNLDGSVFGRFLQSIPIGAITFFVVFSILCFLERKAGADEAG